VEKLLEDLGSPGASKAAIDKLIHLSAADPRVRDYLGKRVPPLIDEGPSGVTRWKSAIKLAGELKLAEAAHALSRWLSVDTGSGFVSLGMETHLELCAPAKALFRIGDPAIPAVQEKLSEGTAKERWRAYLVLDAIGSPKAFAVLREHLSREKDEVLRLCIEKSLESNTEAASPKP
jgi:hypothetical protein